MPGTVLDAQVRGRPCPYSGVMVDENENVFGGGGGVLR